MALGAVGDVPFVGIFAALLYHVLRVVLRRPQEQVIGIHALTIVAAVKDPQPVGNQAVVQNP